MHLSSPSATDLVARSPWPSAAPTSAVVSFRPARPSAPPTAPPSAIGHTSRRGSSWRSGSPGTFDTSPSSRSRRARAFLGGLSRKGPSRSLHPYGRNVSHSFTTPPTKSRLSDSSSLEQMWPHGMYHGASRSKPHVSTWSYQAAGIFMASWFSDRPYKSAK